MQFPSTDGQNSTENNNVAKIEENVQKLLNNFHENSEDNNGRHTF